MLRTTTLLLIALGAQAQAQAIASAAQAEYDGAVSFAKGYTRTAPKLSAMCKKAAPDRSDQADVAIAKWKDKNTSALKEVDAHWQALMERRKEMPKQIDESVEASNLLSSLLEEKGQKAVQYLCDNLSNIIMKTPLEDSLSVELKIIRSCSANAVCQNLGEIN